MQQANATTAGTNTRAIRLAVRAHGRTALSLESGKSRRLFKGTVIAYSTVMCGLVMA